MRENVPSPSPFAAAVGFSAAVRVDNHVFVAGTVGRNPDGSFDKGVYAQTKRALANIGVSLQGARASFEHVVRTRMYVTNIDDWQEASRAHKEVFGEILPASTLIEVSRLATPEMLIEIEVDAIVESG